MGDKTDRVKGGVKETAGQATNDPKLAQEGRRDQAKGNLKSAGEKTKDAIKKL